MLCGLLFLLGWSVAFAQPPGLINYQAVARDASSGQELSNQQVFVLIRILEGGPNGNIVYEESHSGIQTNEYGLLNLGIGGGDASEGSFEDIPWSTGNIWFEMELDSGEGLESMGVMQFVSVPFALYAENAGNTDDDDPDPENELITSAIYDDQNEQIVIQEGTSNEILIPVSAFPTDDADADPQNELIVSGSYNPETNVISITEADGSTIEISLEQLPIEDGDSDPTNELIDSDSGLQLSGTNLQITEAGITYSVNLDTLVEDDDADPENELIDDNGIFLTNDTILTISEAGIAHEVNLSDLRDDDDWEISDQSLYTTDKDVGIGTDSPEAKLDIAQNQGDEAALKVSSEDEVILYAKNERLGLHTDLPQSSTEFAKSVGYEYNLVTNEGNSGYTATEDDHLIVVRLIPTGATVFTVSLPPANECDGRVYIIRKTGSAPGFGEVLIDTGGFPVDFLSPDVELDEPNAETAVLLSLGEDGWSRILRED